MKNTHFNIQRILLDVNVCIDLIVNRAISPGIKKRLFEIFLTKQIDPFVPACSIDTIYYILNSSMKLEKTVIENALKNLLKYTQLLHTTDESVQRAFSSNFSDFEDGLINSLAEVNSMDAIITGNVADFTKSSLPVYRPEDFVAMFE